MDMLMLFFLFTFQIMIRLFLGGPAQHPDMKTNYPTGVSRPRVAASTEHKVNSLAPLRLLAKRTVVSLSSAVLSEKNLTPELRFKLCSLCATTVPPGVMPRVRRTPLCGHGGQHFALDSIVPRHNGE
jgi:hypothetical protein